MQKSPVRTKQIIKLGAMALLLLLVLLPTAVFGRPMLSSSILGQPLSVFVGENGRYMLVERELFSSWSESTIRDHYIFYRGCVLSPAGSSDADNRSDEAWESISQSTVTGRGTLSEPWIIRTTYAAGCQSFGEQIDLEVATTLEYVNGLDYISIGSSVCGGEPNAGIAAAFVDPDNGDATKQFGILDAEGCTLLRTVWQEGQEPAAPTALRLVSISSNQGPQWGVWVGIVGGVALFIISLMAWVNMLTKRNA